MAFIVTPELSVLGEHVVMTNFNHNINVQLESDPDTIQTATLDNTEISLYIDEILTDIEDTPYIIISETPDNYKPKVFKPHTFNIIGKAPLDLYNHLVTYVDKGKSDLNSTPVVTTIGNVPDFKDVYKVDVDPRTQISLKFDFTLNFTVSTKQLNSESSENNGTNNGTTGTGTSSTGNTGNTGNNIVITNEALNFSKTIIITQDYNHVKDWLKDYLENRYHI